jgi:hypothetical protein
MTLYLSLKREYFDQVRAGTKPEEFRRVCPYWTKRLAHPFTRISLTWGYPKGTDQERRVELPWRGMRKTTITHPLFGPEPVEVYAIRLTP